MILEIEVVIEGLGVGDWTLKFGGALESEVLMVVVGRRSQGTLAWRSLRHLGFVCWLVTC